MAVYVGSPLYGVRSSSYIRGFLNGCAPEYSDRVKMCVRVSDARWGLWVVLPARQRVVVGSVWCWWNIALFSPYLGSRECPTLLYKYEDPACVPLRGAEDLAKGDHLPMVVDSRHHLLPCIAVALEGDVLGGA